MIQKLDGLTTLLLATVFAAFLLLFVRGEAGSKRD